MLAHLKSGNSVGCYHSGTTTNEKGKRELLSQWTIDGGLRWATKHKQLVLFFRVIGLSTITNAMAVIKMKILFRYKKRPKGSHAKRAMVFNDRQSPTCVHSDTGKGFSEKKDCHAQMALHQKQKQKLRWNGSALSTFPCSCEPVIIFCLSKLRRPLSCSIPPL